jgi:hypothetical protein
LTSSEKSLPGAHICVRVYDCASRLHARRWPLPVRQGLLLSRTKGFWDKASTLASEVEEPWKTVPKAMFGAVGLVVGTYLIPLLAGTGALPSETAAEWTDGFFSEVGQRIGGSWLRVWIQAAAAMSNMGLFEAEMSSDSFQPSLPAGEM